MLKMLVTGASGFVGGAVLSRLRADGHEAIAAVRWAPQFGQIHIGNIDADTDWTQALNGCDAVVHAAARVHQMQDHAEDRMAEFRCVNVDGTLNLARQAAAAGVKRFVFISTVKVNGEENDSPYRESDPPRPGDPYALSKWEAEQGLNALAGGAMEIVIVRPPVVYGPGAKGNFAALLKLACKGAPLPLASIANRRSLVGLDNLVDFIVLSADREASPRAANQVFLISDGEDVSTPALLRKVALACGTSARLLPVPSGWLRLAARLAGKSAEADRLLGSLTVDISKSRDLLGWRPITTMDQQLRKTVSDAALP